MDAAAQGNTAQAMHVYDRARSILREELGITPGPTIQQAHASFLARDRDDPSGGSISTGTPVAEALLAAGSGR